MERDQQARPGREGWLIAAAAALTAAYLAAIGFTPRWLIGTSEYQWPVLHHGSWARLPLAATLLAGAAALALLLIAELPALLKTRWGRARAYGAMLLLGLAFQLGPAATHRMGLLEYPLRVYLPDHTSYFTDAAKITELRPWLASYPSRTADFATHTRTHPPGAVLLFYAAQRALERLPAVARWYVDAVPRSREAMQTFGLSPAQTAAGGLMAALLLLGAAAMAPLTFALGRGLLSDQRAALAAVLLASAPAFSQHTPVLDHLLAGLILTALWLTLTAIRKGRMARVVGAGAIIGAGLWLGTSVLAALPLIALVGAGVLWEYRGSAPRRRLLVLYASIMVVLVGAAALAVLGLGLALGADYLDVYRAITEVGWNFNNQASGRFQTWSWIAFDPYEFLAWAGTPLAVLFGGAVIGEIWTRVTNPGHGQAWVLAAVGFMAALDLSGKVCYESARLAWFCYPLLAIVAAKSAPLPGPRYRLPALVLGAQIVSTLVMRMIF
jgi:hypothetical protein